MYFDRVTARKDLQFYVFMEAFGLRVPKSLCIRLQKVWWKKVMLRFAPIIASQMWLRLLLSYMMYFPQSAFLRENATDYGIDPEKIGVTGSSAGGYLAVMAAVFDSGDKRTRPNAAVGMGAQTDLTSPHIQNSTVLNWSKFMGGFYREVPQN
jgi:hypothetical protein